MHQKNIEKQPNQDKDAYPELAFPFIPCNYSKHKKYGPQTVLSTAIIKDTNVPLSLCCNTCLRDLPKQDIFKILDIEESCDVFLEKLTSYLPKNPKSMPILDQAYSDRNSRQKKFSDMITRQISQLDQQIDQIMKFVSNALQQKKKKFVQIYSTMQEIYSESQGVFNQIYSMLFLNQEMKNELRMMNEEKFKKQLRGITNPAQYTELVDKMISYQRTISCLENEQEKIGDLLDFNEKVFKFENICGEGILSSIDELTQKIEHTIHETFNQSLFDKLKIPEKIINPMIEFYEHNELNPRNLKSLVDQHKNLIGGDNKNEVPQQVVQEEAEVRNDADEDHDDIYEKFNIKPPEMQLNQNQQVQQLDQNQPFNNIPNQSMNASGMMYAKQIYTPTPFEEIKDMDLYDLQDIPESQIYNLGDVEEKEDEDYAFSLRVNTGDDVRELIPEITHLEVIS